ncbi:Hematopoietically expressed homeobox [Carabus blaptoides fortunei]
MKATGTALYGRDQLWSPYLPYSMMFSCAHLHNRRKGGQVRFTASQTEELEKQFTSHKYLNPEDRKQLASLLRLSDRQVKTWFQNRRAKWRRNNHTECRDTNTLQRNMDEFSGKNGYQT